MTSQKNKTDEHIKEENEEITQDQDRGYLWTSALSNKSAEEEIDIG